MLGAIAGDVIGSRFERSGAPPSGFELFAEDCCATDDTVLTVAIADALLTGESYVDKLKDYYHCYPNAGFGGSFKRWANSSTTEPYNSWGNGSAMRVSPVAYAFDDLAKVLEVAEATAAVTHNHPEGIKGAQAIAAAVFLARIGQGKAEIKAYVSSEFGYDLSRTLAQIRPQYCFDVSCQGSVPESILAFLESTDFEDAIRLAISLGGDTDTMACMAGSIAEAFYGEVPEAIAKEALARLDGELRGVVEAFRDRYVTKRV